MHRKLSVDQDIMTIRNKALKEGNSLEAGRADNYLDGERNSK